jgi:hypothetical protein
MEPSTVDSEQMSSNKDVADGDTAGLGIVSMMPPPVGIL